MPQIWLAIVGFKYPEGTSREARVEVEAETRAQAISAAANMGQAMTHRFNTGDHFDRVLEVRKKPERSWLTRLG